MTEIDGREPHERLREARQALFSSARQAAERHRWKQATYTAHENGTRKFKLDAAKAYGRAFRVNPFWLLFGTEDLSTARIEDFVDDAPEDLTDTPLGTIGSETGRRGIPDDAIAQIDVTGGLGAGGLTIVSESVAAPNGMTFAAEHVRGFWLLPPEVLTSLFARAGDVAAFPVQGDSMEPTLREGDVVFVDTRHRRPSPPGVYALADEFGGLIVKRLEIVSSPRDEAILVNIISDNPRHAPRTLELDDLRIVGRVIRKFGTI